MTKSQNVELLDGVAPPKILVSPQTRTNSWEDVADLSASLGMPLDEWQELVLQHAMGERANGKWASKFIGVSAPRQNGKSQLIVARALAGVLLFGEKLIIISAHETDTARQVWKRLTDVIEANPSIEARVTHRMDAINRESVSFGTGLERQTILLKARGLSGTRGFSADCLLLDEGQRLGKPAWGSIVPTMSAREKSTPGGPQLWLLGTPPTAADDPFAFARVRESAQAGKPRHTWLEWAAAPDDDFDSPLTWAKANPSFGVRLTEEACADDRAAMDDEQFAMERLGIWMEDLDEVPDIFGLGSWQACHAPYDGSVKVAALGIAVTVGSSAASIVAAGLTEDGKVQIRPTDSDVGYGWVVARVKELQDEHGCAVVVDAGGPAGVLLPLLEQAGVNVTAPKVAEFYHAHASMFELVRSRRLQHDTYPPLDEQVAEAKLRSGEKHVLDRKKSDVDVLEAAILAAWAVERPPEPEKRSAYEDHGLLVI